MEKDTKHINLILRRRLWQQVKIKSAIENKTITKWLTELLEKELKK
jgi:hypothetical protein